MESVRKQTIVQVEKTGIKFYNQEGEAIEITSDVNLEPIAICMEGDATVVNMDKEIVQIKDIVKMDVSSVAFSPKKNYLVVCTKPEEGKNNLFIFDRQLKIVAEHIWKGSSIDG